MNIFLVAIGLQLLGFGILFMPGLEQFRFHAGTLNGMGVGIMACWYFTGAWRHGS